MSQTEVHFDRVLVGNRRNVYVYKDIHTQLKVIAAQRGVKIQVVVEEALQRFLDREDSRR